MVFQNFEKKRFKFNFDFYFIYSTILGSVQQQDKSYFTNCLGEVKQNSLSHLPLLVGNNSFWDIFGNNKAIILPKYIVFLIFSSETHFS